MSGNGSAETCRLCGGQTTRLWSLEVLRAHEVSSALNPDPICIKTSDGVEERYLTVPAHENVRNAVILKGNV